MNEFFQYVSHNWLQIVVDVIAGINIVVAGAKAMGWTKLADGCLKVENAIAAMVQAALNRGGSNAQKDISKPDISGGPTANLG